uniref:uncharacterized protein LOC100179877 isoform X2 n=1 Tax=Ciona intestinalis TaxID=7719 RepID=UPI000EF4E0BA|nr:uncharacterized protein LOC100179877 isoform X2 [Ciona intestinalis]|eukprot:XP_026693796.1 uncharacterized protein LOC100179877 isoform X2 [Ciona intestinalis]
MLRKLFTVLLFTLCTRQRYVHGFVELVSGILYEVVTDSKNFDDAEDHCRGLDGLLFYSISTSSIQNALSDAITSNLTLSAHSSFWIGLDDTMHEGRFIWNKGEALPVFNYNNFHPSVEAQAHENEDCVKIDRADSWQWKVTNCAETRPFICQKATCLHRPNIGPTATRNDIPALACPVTVSCHGLQNCINEVCQCNGIFKEGSKDCDKSSGITATHEEMFEGKTYLFFKERVRHTEASNFCKDTYGHLAMPKTKARNDFIYTKARMHLLAFGSTVWIGLLRTNPQSVYEKAEWAFSDYESVNLPPDFGDMTVGGELPLYTYNFTTLTERWHFFYFNTEPWYNRQEAIDHCTLTGSHLPYLLDKSEHDRLIALLKVYAPIWLAAKEENDYPGYYDPSGMWLDFARTDEDLRSFQWSDGTQIFMQRQWYHNHNFPLPTEEQLALPQFWIHPDPNNVIWGSSDPPGSNGMEEAYGCFYHLRGWVDCGSYMKQHVFCEKGPFPFERWYLGGSEHAQPDNKWCVENCGAMRIDLTDVGKADFSDITNEYWVDEWCDKKKPFVCESELPSQCPTYNPPLVQGCVEHYFVQRCTASLSADSLRAFSLLTLRKMSVLIEEISANSTNLEVGVFHELCNGTELLDLGLTPKFRFHVNKQTHADAKSTCADNMEILPSLITSEVAEVFRKKVEDSLKITGVEKWWIGLDDIATEGSFIWSNGEPHDQPGGHYTNWSPTRSGSVSAKDCVAAGADGNAYWTEEACTDAFTFVCMTNYPDGCTTLNGRHTVECLNNLWKRVGCVEMGDKYPEKRSTEIIDTMKNTPLTSLETDIKPIKTSADTGSKPEQLDCYGIEFPDNCLSFYGPYSIECLNSIWNIRGCLNKGTKAPSKLNPSERNSLDALNLKVSRKLYNILRSSFHGVPYKYMEESGLQSRRGEIST